MNDELFLQYCLHVILLHKGQALNVFVLAVYKSFGFVLSISPNIRLAVLMQTKI